METSKIISCPSIDRQYIKYSKLCREFILWALVPSSQEPMHSRSWVGNALLLTFQPQNLIWAKVDRYILSLYNGFCLMCHVTYCSAYILPGSKWGQTTTRVTLQKIFFSVYEHETCFVIDQSIGLSSKKRSIDWASFVTINVIIYRMIS